MRARGPLALLGLRCSGKTTVGRLLAARFDRRFLDLDEELVRWARRSGHAAKGVGDLLRTVGEPRIRALEAELVKLTFEPRPDVVVATGGGIVERADNRAWLQRTAFCVWLDVPQELLAQRLEASRATRPGFGDADAAAEVARLHARRAEWYRALASVHLEPGDEAPEEIAARIAQIVGA